MSSLVSSLIYVPNLFSGKEKKKVYQPNQYEIQKKSCQICQKIFKKQTALNLHMESVHDNSRFKVFLENGTQMFECQLCHDKINSLSLGMVIQDVEY